MTEYLRILRPTQPLTLFYRSVLSLFCIVSILILSPAIAEERSIRLWHWWNSAGEAQSSKVLTKYLAQHNIHWNETDVKGASTSLYLNGIRSLLEEDRPDAALMTSSEIKSYDTEFDLIHFDDIAQEQGWEEVVPYAIQDSAKNQGHWASVPINSHSTNWLWINKRLFSRLNLPEPETWNDLITVLERAKTLGIPVLATLNDDWEQTLLFELVVMSTGGLEFYRRFFVDHQFNDGDKYILAESFIRLKQLTQYFTTARHAVKWHQHTALLSQDEVLMQVHGSWVNSELATLGAKADIDFLCMRFPGTQGAYLFHSDHVIFFNEPHNRVENQQQLARILLDKNFQRELSIASGASPARVDIDTDGFNSCSKKSIHDLRMANMRRAVMASLSNKDLYKIVADFLEDRTSAELSAKQVLAIFSK